MKNRFYLTSSHGNLGSNVVWHRHNEEGYTTDLDQAHVYTREQAQKEWSDSWGECEAISADHVDELAVWKVDCQYIPNKTQPFMDAQNKYVAFEKGVFDGNDVWWMISKNQNTSTDFGQAYVMVAYEAMKLPSRFIVIPFDMADKVKRRTFDFRKLNKRVMVQGAGLVTPEHVKKIKRRVKNPMTRFNCPECGKINWQHNPYDFEACDHCCHGWGDMP